MWIGRGVNCLVIELPLHKPVEQVLSTVRRHRLFENDVEISKQIVLPKLPRIWIHKVSQVGDLGLRQDNMESPDLEKLSRLVRHSVFDRCVS